VKRCIAVCAAVWMCGCGNVASVVPPGNVLLPAGSEQYIWVSSPSPDATAPRMFRKSFSLVSVPMSATLYVFGPYNADVLINGASVIHQAQGGPILTNERPLEIAEISNVLMTGTNTISVTASGSEILAFKIIPAEQGINAQPLVVSDGLWEGSTDGTSWMPVSSFGSLESDVTRFKGNFDLNLYEWPGYQGINAILDHALIGSGFLHFKQREQRDAGFRQGNPGPVESGFNLFHGGAPANELWGDFARGDTRFFHDRATKPGGFQRERRRTAR